MGVVTAITLFWPNKPNPAMHTPERALSVRKNVATLAWYYFIVPGYYKTVPSRQHEFVTLLGRKMLHWVCLGPQGGCWGPVLSFSSCRLGHFFVKWRPAPLAIWGLGFL